MSVDLVALRIAADKRHALFVSSPDVDSAVTLIGDYKLTISNLSGKTSYKISGKDKEFRYKSDVAQGLVDLAFEPEHESGAVTTRKKRFTQLKRILSKGEASCYWCKANLPGSLIRLAFNTPLVKGGVDRYDNLVVACPACVEKHGNEVEKLDGQAVIVPSAVGKEEQAVAVKSEQKVGFEVVEVDDKGWKKPRPVSIHELENSQVPEAAVVTAPKISTISAKSAGEVSFLVVGFMSDTSAQFSYKVEAHDWREAICAVRDKVGDKTHRSTTIVSVLRYGAGNALIPEPEQGGLITGPVGRADIRINLRAVMPCFTRDTFSGFISTEQAEAFMRLVVDYLASRAALWPSDNLVSDFTVFVRDSKFVS